MFRGETSTLFILFQRRIHLYTKNQYIIHHIILKTNSYIHVYICIQMITDTSWSIITDLFLSSYGYLVCFHTKQGTEL